MRTLQRSFHFIQFFVSITTDNSLYIISHCDTTHPLLFLGEDFPDPGEDVDPDTVGQVRGAVTELGEGGQVQHRL